MSGGMLSINVDNFGARRCILEPFEAVPLYICNTQKYIIMRIVNAPYRAKLATSRASFRKVFKHHATMSLYSGHVHLLSQRISEIILVIVKP